MVVRGVCRQAFVFDGLTEGEVVQALMRSPLKPHHFMDRIIEETSDARPTGSVSFGEVR